MVIWYLHRRSDALESGLQVDDVVLKINGQPAHTHFDSPELSKTIQTDDTLTLVYRPKAGGPAKTAEIKVLDVLK